MNRFIYEKLKVTIVTLISYTRDMYKMRGRGFPSLEPYPKTARATCTQTKTMDTGV